MYIKQVIYDVSVLQVETQPGIIEVLHNHSLYFQPFDASNVVPSVHTQAYRCVAKNRIGQVISRIVHTVAGKWMLRILHAIDCLTARTSVCPITMYTGPTPMYPCVYM